METLKMKDMDEIQAKDIHIAVINKQFKTTNYQSGGFIWWNENEAVQAIKHNGNQESPLWYCVKLDASVAEQTISDIVYNGRVVAKSHLDFVDIKWGKLK